MKKKLKTQNWVIKVSFRYYLQTNDKRIRVFYTFYMRDVSCSIFHSFMFSNQNFYRNKK
jgi:hypothetical protein